MDEIDRQQYFSKIPFRSFEWDEIYQQQHFSKIPFRSFEQDGISQKLNLAHAWVRWKLDRMGLMMAFKSFWVKQMNYKQEFQVKIKNSWSQNNN